MGNIKETKLESLRIRYREIQSIKKELEDLTHKLLHKSESFDAVKIESLKKHIKKKGRQLTKMTEQWNEDRDGFTYQYKDETDPETLQKLLKIKL